MAGKPTRTGNIAEIARSRADYRLLDNVIFNVGKLANSYARSAARFYPRHFNLSVPEVRVLNVIGHHAPVTAVAIADLGMMDKALVSRAVARLVGEGLVARGADHGDGRRQLLTLTPAGRRSCVAVLAAKQRRHARSLVGLSGAEVEQFYALLARLQAGAEAMEREEIAAEAEESAA